MWHQTADLNARQAARRAYLDISRCLTPSLSRKPVNIEQLLIFGGSIHKAFKQGNMWTRILMLFLDSLKTGFEEKHREDRPDKQCRNTKI